MNETVYDLVGIGIGPFNLGLAALTDPIDSLDTLFLDERPGFDWHPGMLMDSALLQTPFMADLVTLADPTSRYSFLNYAKHTGRLYPFYIRENFFLHRKEYNHYCQWVAAQLPQLQFAQRVVDIDYDRQQDHYRVQVLDRREDRRYTCLARHLVFGVGSQPHLPEICPDDPRILHSSEYLPHKANLVCSDRITVVGSGQSAAEIVYDLLTDIDLYGYRLQWVTRSPRYFPLEYTKLTLEMTSPDYIDHFHRLDETQRDRLVREQAGLYKGINQELINALYDLLYEKSLDRPVPVTLAPNHTLTAVQTSGEALTCEFQQNETGEPLILNSEAVVMATGYRPRVPDCLAPIADQIQWTDDGRYRIGRFYNIDSRHRLFVQNAGLHSHGLTSPDLGMGCYRNACIIRALTGIEHYLIERRIAFQSFGGAPRFDASSDQPAREHDYEPSA